MSNEEILNKRWNMTDKILDNSIKHFKLIGVNTIDDIVEMINSLDITYNDLNKPISKADKRKLDKNIKEWKKSKLFNGYFAYLVTSKSKYTYADLIEILLYWIYIVQEKEFDELSKLIFIEVVDDIYSQALDEIPIKPKKEFSLTWEFILGFLWIPIYNKSWKEYLKLLTMTNQQEMYKLVIGNLQQDRPIKETDLKELTRKQINRIISINDSKYSGVLSDTCRLLGNKIYTEPFKEEKKLQVRFIAEMDEKTTKMCEGMNNMLFFVNDWNKFYRYSVLDKKDVLYTVKGLELGVNLPPINNHFHWCRSTITYLIDRDIRKKYKDITKEWLQKNNKHYDVSMLNNVFNYNGVKYKIDNHNVKYELKKGEEKFAYWLANNSSKKVTLLPKINNPERISTPDYLIDNEYFDYKYTTGSSSQLLYHNLYDKQEQSSNFIIEITSDAIDWTEIYEQVEYVYRRLSWVKKIGIKKEEKFILFERQ